MCAAIICALGGCSGGGSTLTSVGSGTIAGAGYHAATGDAVLRIQGTASSDFPPLVPGAPVTVVNLWAQWCGPCRTEAPILRQAQARLSGRGVQFVGVNTEDSTTKANRFAYSEGWRWAQFYDESGLTMRGAHFSGLPDTLILGPGDRIAGYYIGPVTNLAAFTNIVLTLARRLSSTEGS